MINSMDFKRRSKTSEVVLGLKLTFLLLCFVTVVTLILLAVSTDDIHDFLVHLATEHDYNKKQFVIIIDDDSITSRLFVYRFDWSFIDNRLLLIQEYYYEHVLGLSALADKPEEAANSIKLLLDTVAAHIPTDQWSSTPVILKATAELRLLPQLPQSKTEDLLNAVRHLFGQANFSVDVDTVNILEDTEKGIFSWLAINFLFKRLSNDIKFAALELSEDSMRVTFIPSLEHQVTIYKDYMQKVNTLDRKFDVFTHTYSDLGLMAARQAVFTEGYDRSESNVASICVHESIWNHKCTFFNMEYKVSGKYSPNSGVDFNACHDLVRRIVKPIPKPYIPKEQLVLAFNYYFEAAVESELIDESKEGTVVTVQGYYNIAQYVCSWPNDEQPFLCFDLIYISVLLREGFGFGDDKIILLYRQFNNHKISWTLGCAYNLIVQELKAKSRTKNPNAINKNL